MMGLVVVMVMGAGLEAGRWVVCCCGVADQESGSTFAGDAV